MRIMGLDLGEAWTGVAFSDPSATVAIPTTVLDTRKPDFLDTLRALAEEREVGRVVVGMPLSMDGAPRRQARWVRGMQRRLADYLAVPVDSWDERLSTAAAQRQLHDAGANREEMGLRENATAAAFILQGYLDRQRNLARRASRQDG